MPRTRDLGDGHPREIVIRGDLAQPPVANPAPEEIETVSPRPKPSASPCLPDLPTHSHRQVRLEVDSRSTM